MYKKSDQTHQRMVTPVVKKWTHVKICRKDDPRTRRFVFHGLLNQELGLAHVYNKIQNKDTKEEMTKDQCE